MSEVNVFTAHISCQIKGMWPTLNVEVESRPWFGTEPLYYIPSMRITLLEPV